MARDRTPRRQAKGEREPIFEVPSSGRPRGLKVNREEGGRERERERESEATVPPAGSKGIKGDCTKVAGMPDVGKKDDSHRGMLIPTWWRSQGLRSGERISLSLSLFLLDSLVYTDRLNCVPLLALQGASRNANMVFRCLGILLLEITALGKWSFHFLSS